MPIREIKLQFRVFVDRDGDLFHAYTPDLKGVHAAGESQLEALDAIGEAASLYVQSLVKHNESIPVGLLVLDREHSSKLALLGSVFKELFFKKPESYVKEVSVPTQGQELIHCA